MPVNWIIQEAELTLPPVIRAVVLGRYLHIRKNKAVTTVQWKAIKAK